jgi:hypothetical protein
VDQHCGTLIGTVMQKRQDAGIIEILFAYVIADFYADMPGVHAASKLRAGRVNILQRHLAQSSKSSLASVAHFQSGIIKEARTFEGTLRLAVVREKNRSRRNYLLVYSVAIHFLETHTDVPAIRGYAPKFALPEHDYGFAGFGVLYARPIGRAKSRRQVRPGLREKMRVDVSDWHLCLQFVDSSLPGRRLARMNFSTVRAGSQSFVLIESLEQRRQIRDDALQEHFGAMDQVVTLPAIPFKAVFGALGTRNFDYQTDGSRRVTLRRMAHVLWQQKDLALLDRYLQGRLSRLFHHANENIAFQLVEKFLGGIVVIIHALIGSTYDGHDNVAVVPNLRVANRRLQFVTIGVNPSLKIESLQRLDGWHYFFLSAVATGL